jgi:23S rRNA pseudouridine2605 synthase
MNTQKSQLDSLSKYLAQAGVASRRKVVDLIKSKSVTVNGVMVNEPGFKLNRTDCVRVGVNIVRSEPKIYLLLNKPKNCITNMSDDLGRHGVIDIISDQIKQRVYPVGRLDRNATGLLVLTNDGEMTLKLSHPRFEIEQEYHVQLDKPFTRKDLYAITTSGVMVEDKSVTVDGAFFFKGRSKNNLAITFNSGQYKILRKLFEHLGYDIRKVDRVSYAGLEKNGLQVGAWRHLTSAEISYLKQQ